MNNARPYEMDFSDYLESCGGVYLPFPRAVESTVSLAWCRSIWEALLTDIRPPASRVAEMLRRQDYLKAYLPSDVAADYPGVSNPYKP